MARWQPGARDRLQLAALELFTTRGFDQTTAAEIAESVGLTERTFFRHFSDKREVLFFGQDEFVRSFLDGVAEAPDDAGAMAVVAAGVHAATTPFTEQRRPFSQMRQAVIDANPPLRERERHKLAGLSAEVAEVLRGRGVGEPAATLAAESGSTVLTVAFALWVRDGETRPLPDIAAEVLRELSAVTRHDATVSSSRVVLGRRGRGAAYP